MIFGHVHEWEIVHQRTWDLCDEGDKIVAAGIEYHLRCKNCGAMKFADSRKKS